MNQRTTIPVPKGNTPEEERALRVLRHMPPLSPELTCFYAKSINAMLEQEAASKTIPAPPLS